MNYRDHAQNCVARANLELVSGNEDRIPYAALELRFALEALTYDRAAAYKDEFPESEYRAWQPRKVMAVLLEIDSTADTDVSLRSGKENVVGQPTPKLLPRGTDAKLSMATIKEHYDALGSFLHIPTIKQLANDHTINISERKKRCEIIAEILKKILASTIWNVTIGDFVSFGCSECNGKIRKRLPSPGSESERAIVNCTTENCLASYTLIKLENGRFQLQLEKQLLPCGNENCDEKTVVLKNEHKEGNCWTCRTCQSRNLITLGVITVRFAETN